MAPQSRSGGKSKSRKTRQGKQGRSSRSWLRHPLTIALVPVIAGAALTALFFYIQNRPAAPSPKIELDSVQVRTVNNGSESTGIFSNKVYFQLRNTGRQLAVIRAVGIRVDYFTQIPNCLSQGALATTGHYSANLSLHPRLGSAFSVPVSQQIPPDSADRFEITLRIPPDYNETIYLYRLHLSLFYDNLKTPLNAGDILASLPYNPTTQEYVWDRTYQAEHGKPIYFRGNEAPKISKCMINNSKKVRSLLSLPGSRSSGLASLPPILSYCCAVSTVDEVPVLGTDWEELNLKGYGQSRPPVIYNGEDPSGLVTHIRWQSWGGQTAIGEGTAWYVGTGARIVADGHEAPVRVVAFHLGTCGTYRAYTAIEWYFPQHGEKFTPKHYINICTGQFIGGGPPGQVSH